MRLGYFLMSVLEAVRWDWGNVIICLCTVFCARWILDWVAYSATFIIIILLLLVSTMILNNFQSLLLRVHGSHSIAIVGINRIWCVLLRDYHSVMLLFAYWWGFAWFRWFFTWYKWLGRWTKWTIYYVFKNLKKVSIIVN